MGIPDFWSTFIKRGESVGRMWHEMTNRRSYERTVSYVACHDQCINGKDAMIWRLIGDEMYTTMSCFATSWKTSRGIALYKLMRLVTLGTADRGWLNFMGDEFGHPEWIDADAYAHRQWHLPEIPHARYAGLAAFDRAMLVDVLQTRLADFARAPVLRHLHEADRTLAFERGCLLFAFNFHETEARPGLDVWATAGRYVEYLSTDALDYAGHGNLEISRPGLEHFSRPSGNGAHQAGAGALERITLYLPPLVGMVLTNA
jgi:1,4-alpha-glucan branching enzyme